MCQGDEIIEVNGHKLKDKTHSEAVILMRKAPPICNLVVRSRTKDNEPIPTEYGYEFATRGYISLSLSLPLPLPLPLPFPLPLPLPLPLHLPLPIPIPLPLHLPLPLPLHLPLPLILTLTLTLTLLLNKYLDFCLTYYNFSL